MMINMPKHICYTLYVILSALILSFIMLNVIRLNVYLMSVVAPWSILEITSVGVCHFYKTFFFVRYNQVKQAGVFAPGKQFQPTLIFESIGPNLPKWCSTLGQARVLILKYSTRLKKLSKYFRAEHISGPPQKGQAAILTYKFQTRAVKGANTTAYLFGGSVTKKKVLKL